MIAKRRVVIFLKHWTALALHTFYLDPVGPAFIEELYAALVEDSKQIPTLTQELRLMNELLAERDVAMQAATRQPHVVLDCGILRPNPHRSSLIFPFDTSVIKILGPDSTYTTLKIRLDKTTRQILQTAATKLGIGFENDAVLVEIRSTGERCVFHPNDVSIPTTLSLNGRLFAVLRQHVDHLKPLPEQDGPLQSYHMVLLERISTLDFAHHLAFINWELFTNVSFEVL